MKRILNGEPLIQEHDDSGEFHVATKKNYKHIKHLKRLIIKSYIQAIWAYL